MSNVTHPTPDPTGQYPPQQGYYQPYPLQPPQPPKRGMSTGAILAIVFGSIAALCIVGSVATAIVGADDKPPAGVTATSAPTALPAEPTTKAPTGPVSVPLGQTLVSESLGSEVHYTLTAGKPVTKTKFGSKAEKGQFFSVTATVKVVKGSAYVYGGDFALITTAGTPYEGSASLLVEGGIEGVQANAGQTVTGLVVFDIPVGAEKGAKVELRELFASNQAFWQLP